jgi:hypothetical protein
MKSLSFSIGCAVLLIAAQGVFAAAPPTNAPPTASAPAAAQDQKPAMPAQSPPPTNAAPVSVPPAEPAGLKFDDYLKDLGDTLKLTDEEKKSIQADYFADDARLENILNNDSLSPLQKARQVSGLRDARNARIEALLGNADRQRAFLQVEARYRVALTELAADGGLVAAPPPPPAPAGNNAPGQMGKTPH